MKYWQGANFGDYWTKSPTFNPPIIITYSMHMCHFIKIANINSAKMFSFVFCQIILLPMFHLIQYFTVQYFTPSNAQIWYQIVNMHVQTEATDHTNIMDNILHIS